MLITKLHVLTRRRPSYGRVRFGLQNAQQLYPWAKIRQAFLLFTHVGNHAMTTTHATRQANTLPIHYKLCALTLARYSWLSMANPQAQRMIQAHDSNERLNSGIAQMNTAHLNRGGGGRPAKYFYHCYP